MGSSDEVERPTEWLHGLMQDPSRYVELLRDAGSVAVAAHRLARARCRVQPLSAAVPSASELRRAALDITQRAGAFPSLRVDELVAECETAGLAVIAPFEAA